MMLMTIRLEKLILQASIGVYEWEQASSRELYVNVDVVVDVTHAVASDKISDTLDYDTLAMTIKDVAQQKHYNLVETLCVAMSNSIKQFSGVVNLSLEIFKPGAVADAAMTSICYHDTVE